MTWHYTFKRRFSTDMKKLERAFTERVVRTLERIQEDPLRSMKRLRDTDTWSLRIGDYRLLADVDHANRSIQFTRIGHRRTVYDQ